MTFGQIPDFMKFSSKSPYLVSLQFGHFVDICDSVPCIVFLTKYICLKFVCVYCRIVAVIELAKNTFSVHFDNVN